MTGISADGKYIEKLGAPYLQYGVQIVPNRHSKMTDAETEMFYQKAAEIGFEKVAVAVRWKEIEPWEGAYNLYSVEKIIEYANKYDLDVEIIWFGSNACGSIGHAPNYVCNSPERFQKIGDNFDYSNEALLSRETQALKILMNFIYDEDINRCVSMVQIENEPNFHETYNQQRTAFLNYLNTMGLAVKNSPYKVVTRVNLQINDSYLDTANTLPEEILALEGIDIVGPDVYTNGIGYYDSFIERFSTGTMSGNIMHFAEAPGQVDTYLKLVMNALSKQSGYYTYELKTYGNTNFDLGIFRKGDEWIKRDGTQSTAFEWNSTYMIPESITDDIIMLNGMISAVSEQLVLCGETITMLSDDETDAVAGCNFTFESDTDRVQNHVALVFMYDGYYYLFTPASSARITINKSVTGSASIGGFVDGSWQETANSQIVDGVLNATGGNVYRIAVSQIV